MTRQLEGASRVGRSPVVVTPLGLGGGALGGMYDTVAEDDACAAVLSAYESGVRYFDTAPLYGHGRSERRVGTALSGVDRSTFAISTKVGVVIEPRSDTGPGAERRYADPFLLDGRFDFGYDACLRSLEGSLARLGMDRVDIVYIHDPDEGESALLPSERRGANHLPEVMDGTYRALSELRDQGVVGAVGVGLNGTELLREFARAGDFDCFLLAGRYTLLEQREALDGLLPLCAERGVSIVVGGVFNSGILATGASVSRPMYNYRPADPEIVAQVHEIEAVCAEHGVHLPAAALQFPLAHEVVVSVIPGARSPSEATENSRAMAEAIPPSFWTRLAERELIDPGAPVPTEPLGRPASGLIEPRSP